MVLYGGNVRQISYWYRIVKGRCASNRHRPILTGNKKAKIIVRAEPKYSVEEIFLSHNSLPNRASVHSCHGYSHSNSANSMTPHTIDSIVLRMYKVSCHCMLTKATGKPKQLRIALVMLDQKYGGMQQAFLNYSIELSKRGFPVLCVIRNESFVENKLRKAGISSIAIINNRFGFHDPFAIRQFGEALDEFFHCPPPHIVQSFGFHATLFASRHKSQIRRWPLITSLPNSINNKYYKGADIAGTFNESYGDLELSQESG